MVTERLIRRTLHRLAQQKVALILQPGNVWVIERAVSEEENPDIAAALRTCQLRGWVAPEANAVPQYSLESNGKLPKEPRSVAPVYRLTEAGWSVIYRSQAWVFSTFIIATATLLATVLGVLLTLRGH
jgi:hypothetical protein